MMLTLFYNNKKLISTQIYKNGQRQKALVRLGLLRYKKALCINKVLF